MRYDLFYNFTLIAKPLPKDFEGINTSMGVHVAFHDRRTDDLLFVLAFICLTPHFLGALCR